MTRVVTTQCPLCAETIPTGAVRCRHCLSDLPGKGVRAWIGMHGRVLASLIGSALFTSWLVPLVVEELNHHRVVYDARVQIATQVVSDATTTETQLDDPETILGMFIQDSPHLSRTQFQVEQAEARARMAAEYLEFNRIGWWWYTRVQRDADFPEPLTKERKDKLSVLATDYADALTKTTDALTLEWNAILREGASSGTPASTLNALVQRQKLLLAKLGDRRRADAQEMAHLFDQPPSKKWLIF